MDERKNSFGEEIGATGQRVKGAAKDALGSVTGNERLEREGEIENAQGKQRQAANDALGGLSSGVGGSTTGAAAAGAANALGTSSQPVESSFTTIGSADNAGSSSSTAGTSSGSTASSSSLGTTGASSSSVGSSSGTTGSSYGAAGSSSTKDWNSSGYRTSSGYVSGVYRTPEEATRAYEGLTTRHGYKSSDIDVLMSDDTRQRHFAGVKPGEELSSGTKAAEGFTAGSTIGGGVGAALGALFAVGSNFVVPGIGLVVAGPIAAALAGAGAGGATGGLIGALVGAGIPEDRAAEYDRQVKEGGIVIGTRARDDAHAVELERDYNTFGGTSVIR